MTFGTASYQFIVLISLYFYSMPVIQYVPSGILNCLPLRFGNRSFEDLLENILNHVLVRPIQCILQLLIAIRIRTGTLMISVFLKYSVVFYENLAIL